VTESLLSDISFEASGCSGEPVVVDVGHARAHTGDLAADADLS